MKKIIMCGVLLSAALLVIPGCSWFGGDSTSEARSGEAAVKLGGTNILSTDDFRQYLDTLRKMQPGFEEQIASMPEESQHTVFKNIIEGHIAGALAKKLMAQEGWDKDPIYQASARMMHNELDRNLAMMEIQKRLAERVKPSDADLMAWYEKNRATHPYMKFPPFVTEAEGVQAVAFKAKDEAQAKQVMASAKVQGRGLKKAAAEIGGKADDLGLVSVQSTKPDRVIVMKILGAQTFPTVDMVKSGDNWWVVESVSKKEAKFAPFEAVKNEAEQHMRNELFLKEFQNQMDKLKEQNKPEINDNFINSLIIRRAPAQAAS